jgi:hypothetical protein
MSSNHDQAAKTLLKPQPVIMIIETPRLFPIQTSAEVKDWKENGQNRNCKKLKQCMCPLPNTKAKKRLA